MTTRPARATAARQRELLEQIHTPGFFASPAGLEFVAQIRAYTAPGMLREAREWGYPISLDEMVNIVFIKIAELPPRALESCARAGTPWAYLFRVIKKRLWSEWGHRGTSLDAIADWYEPTATTFGPDADAAHPKAEDETRIAEIVELTQALVIPRTPASVQGPVSGLIEWFAWHPVRRLTYEALDRAEARLEFPALSLTQIGAVMNIVVGGRPDRPETSLFAAVAADPKFHPAQAPTIARALNRYRTEMAKTVPTARKVVL